MRRFVRIVKRYYDLGYYTKEDIDLLLSKKKLTEEEYDYIIGKTTDVS